MFVDRATNRSTVFTTFPSEHVVFRNNGIFFVQLVNSKLLKLESLSRKIMLAVKVVKKIENSVEKLSSQRVKSCRLIKYSIETLKCVLIQFQDYNNEYANLNDFSKFSRRCNVIQSTCTSVLSARQRHRYLSKEVAPFQFELISEKWHRYDVFVNSLGNRYKKQL